MITYDAKDGYRSTDIGALLASLTKPKLVITNAEFLTVEAFWALYAWIGDNQAEWDLELQTANKEKVLPLLQQYIK